MTLSTRTGQTPSTVVRRVGDSAEKPPSVFVADEVTLIAGPWLEQRIPLDSASAETQRRTP